MGTVFDLVGERIKRMQNKAMILLLYTTARFDLLEADYSLPPLPPLLGTQKKRKKNSV